MIDKQTKKMKKINKNKKISYRLTSVWKGFTEKEEREESVTTTLKNLLDENKINQRFFEKLKPTGSQAPRIYGLAKVHKADIPLRPVLLMPGSTYHKIANQVAEWLKVVKECNINTSTKLIADSLENVHSEQDDEMVNFDMVFLYTNIPVKEAIGDCTELLFPSRYKKPTCF